MKENKKTPLPECNKSADPSLKFCARCQKWVSYTVNCGVCTCSICKYAILPQEASVL